nr:transposase [Actinomyces procaprae]
MRERGLKVPTDQDPEGVVLVTSDAHWGIKNAVKAILPGASWQRCREPLRPQHLPPSSARPAPSP